MERIYNILYLVVSIVVINGCSVVQPSPMIKQSNISPYSLVALEKQKEGLH